MDTLKEKIEASPLFQTDNENQEFFAWCPEVSHFSETPWASRTYTFAQPSHVPLSDYELVNYFDNDGRNKNSDQNIITMAVIIMVIVILIVDTTKLLIVTVIVKIVIRWRSGFSGLSTQSAPANDPAEDGDFPKLWIPF